MKVLIYCTSISLWAWTISKLLWMLSTVYMWYITPICQK